MSEPKVLIVDRDDNPAGSKDKLEIWKTGEIHRIVWVVIENSEGQILLQKRPATMELYPGRWDVSMGGHVDEGETWEKAAHRELEEELGLKNQKFIKLGKFYDENKFEWRNLNRFYKTYKAVTDQKHFNFDKHEVAEVKWMDVAKIKTMIKNHPEKTTNGLKEVLKRYYS